MVRLALQLGLALVLVSVSQGRFSCPPHLTSYCFESDENEFKIHCATNVTTAAAFDITIKPEHLVRIQCRNSPDWSSFLHGSSLNVGSVDRFVLASCAPTGPRYTARIVEWQLNLSGVEYLKYENLQAPLSPEDLEIFPGAMYLVLSNNPMKAVRPDLLRGLSHLKQLEMRNTNIEIPRGFFDSSSSLKTIELSGNNMKFLIPGIFDGLKRVELLNLWKNDFEELQPGVFRNLQSLISLDIHQNNLKTLPVNIFADLNNLEIINFSANNFTSLPTDLFLFNPKLKIVKLLYNKANLTTLPGRFFANLADLHIVSLMRSGLLYLPEDLFWGSRKIIDLNLNRNYLKSLPVNLLKDAVELHTLGLSFNDLQKLDAGIFSNNKKLVKLDLSRNHLTFIGEHTFAGLESLQELNIENNDLSYIQVDAFMSLAELKIAKFANNKLTLRTSLFDIFGHVSPFHPCSSLEKLYLSHNNISEMFSDWIISGTNLRQLDLSYNNFDYLQSEDLQFMSSKITVDLTHNNINQVNLERLELISKNHSTVDESGFNMSRNVSVLLTSNPIQCDCEIYSLLRYLNNQMVPQAQAFVQLNVEDIPCNGPDYMEGLFLTELNPRVLRCLVETEDPQNGDPCAANATCDCWLRPFDNALLLDCAGKNMTSAPMWINDQGINCIEIDLSMNELKTTPNMSAAGYDKVTKLNLAENKISTLDENLITPNLKVLKLDGNNLTSINSQILKKLSNESNIKKLTLHNNPWRCDCLSRDLFSFVQSNFLEIPELLNVTCKNSNISISVLSIDELCPFPHRLLLILCSFIGSFGFLLGCILAFYFRFQREIKIWLYSKNLCLCLVTEDEIDRDKIYDAFISYSHKDEEFVVKELVTRLEEGPKPYKLCIHIRDWLAGEWIPMQIMRSVEESRRTVVVLSPNFIESVWGRMEFQTAHKQALSEKRARVIIVVYGEIGPIEKLDPDLRSYLQMNTYVKWGDPWFWQKLKYALPHSVGLSKKIDVENNCLDTLKNAKICGKKQLHHELKVTFLDEIEKNQLNPGFVDDNEKKKITSDFIDNNEENKRINNSNLMSEDA